MIDVSLIGTGGMMPLPKRFLTSLICRMNGKCIMIDCGEGTQVSLKMLGWGFKNIDGICFTHCHADHISGLPGLLLTIGNAGRTLPFILTGPVGLAYIVRGLRVIAPDLPFEVIVNEIPAHTAQSFSVGEYFIDAFPVDHGIPCFAYRLSIKRCGKFDVEKAKALQIPMRLWSALQKNNQVEYDDNGQKKLLTSDMVLGPDRRGIIVSYCTDTRPVKGLADFVRDSDLFVCEGIYGEDEKLDKAREHRHMVFSEAAVVARDACVNELWLTHFSPALTDPARFLPVAEAIFSKSFVGYDRKSTTIHFKDE